MALQPNSGPGLPLWGFVTITFYRAGLLVQRPTPNLEDQVSVCVTPGDRVAQLYPQALGTHFSRLLRHAWFTVGLFFNPGHHTGVYECMWLFTALPLHNGEVSSARAFHLRHYSTDVNVESTINAVGRI
jgi:hypothetical protein